jgi:hypothetical protein
MGEIAATPNFSMRKINAPHFLSGGALLAFVCCFRHS